MNKYDLQWQQMYLLAKEYFEENGHLLIPGDYEAKNGVKLGKWIKHQREFYKNERLSQERIELLESIEMIWDVLEFQWQQMYQLAKEYFEENGHLLIPNRFKTKDGICLGQWLCNQRDSYKRGTLIQERIILLESIEMIWILEVQWQEKYNLAKKFFKENGHLLIPQDYETKDGIKLGRWIGHQREFYKNERLSLEKVKLLESIGMIWNGLDLQWQQMYQLAKEYFEENGHLLIPNRFKTKDGISLGQWLCDQKTKYKNTLLDKNKRNKKIGYLSQEQIKMLNSIGIVWDVLEAQWQEKYNLAKEYFKENGHLLIPKDYETKDGIKLGRWISDQKTKYKNTLLYKNKRNKKIGYLSQEQIKMLTSIGIVWDVLEAQWQEKYNLAKEYFKENGHLLIPKDYETKDGIKLGRWISHQRNYYKNNRLSIEQVNLFNEINMVWDASYNIGTSFPEYFVYYILKKYYGEEKVLYRDKSLGCELDVYIPHLNLAIEYDGVTWHNDEKDIKKDIKTSLEGITLYRLRELGLNKLETSNCFCLKNSSNNILKLISEIYDYISNIFNINVDFSFQEIYNEYVIKYLNTNPWNKNFKLAKKFYNENGHLRIHRNYKIDGVALGNWLNKQRQAYKKETLSYSQIEKLNSIGIIWELRQKKGSKSFNVN